MHSDPQKFKKEVEKSLVRQVSAINYLTKNGMFFFDYGNAFLLQASRAGADIVKEDPMSNRQFKYPSYVQVCKIDLLHDFERYFCFFIILIEFTKLPKSEF